MISINTRLKTVKENDLEHAILVGVRLKDDRSSWSLEDSLVELQQLAISAGVKVAGMIMQKVARPSPYYIGTGKLDDLVALQQSTGSEVIIFDDELSPLQQKNLEQVTHVKVIDRTALILDIFARRAQTREGQLQVELAQHQYLLPRLVGQWSHLERLGGGVGTRGPGESQLETDRRLIRQRISRIEKDIEKVRTHRTLYRQKRERAGIPVVSLVGYTSAGKSTLLNALSGAGVMVSNSLFSTLDPVTRRIRLSGGFEVLVTDTVGFIQKLPPAVVLAFRATFEELQEADLLLHVIDITHKNTLEQAGTVKSLLKELNLSEKPILTVYNKVDLLPESRDEAGFNNLVQYYQNKNADAESIVLISAAKKWGLKELVTTITRMLSGSTLLCGDIM